LKYCKTLKGCPTGSTKISPGFDLPSKHVLHTVGPIYDDEEAEECEEELQGCYASTLQLAVDNECRTVALCGVSTGVYGYPLREATEVALRTTRTFLDEHEDKVSHSTVVNMHGSSLTGNSTQFERIIFCNFGNRDVKAYRQLAVRRPPSRRFSVEAHSVHIQPTYFPPEDEAESPEPAEEAATSEADAEPDAEAEAGTTTEGTRDKDQADELQAEQADSQADTPAEDAVGKAQL
jgi:O-acetyl-ADP-ribose deacetylase (regulator of RNase III)